MYQQFKVKQIKGKIVTSLTDHWFNIDYIGADCGDMSFFFPDNFTREQIAEQIGAFRDSLADQMAEFQKGGE